MACLVLIYNTMFEILFQTVQFADLYQLTKTNDTSTDKALTEWPFIFSFSSIYFNLWALEQLSGWLLISYASLNDDTKIVGDYNNNNNNKNNNINSYNKFNHNYNFNNNNNVFGSRRGTWNSRSSFTQSRNSRQVYDHTQVSPMTGTEKVTQALTHNANIASLAGAHTSSSPKRNKNDRVTSLLG